jgi:hypothetical protein
VIASKKSGRQSRCRTSSRCSGDPGKYTFLLGRDRNHRPPVGPS